MAPALHELQRLFRAWMADPAMVLPPGSFRVGPGRLTPEARLAIYRRDYWGRMEEVAGELFPNLFRLLGEEEAAALTERFLRQMKFSDDDLAQVGHELPAFLQTDAVSQEFAFLPDLARAEWEIFRAFHREYLPPLTSGAWAELSPQDWPLTRISCQPSLVLLASPWRLAALLHVKDQQLEDFNLDEALKPEATWLRVVRRADGQVDWRTIEEGAYRVLTRVQGGETLGSVLEGLRESEAENVRSWFQAWMTEGLFVGVNVPNRA